MRTGIVLLIGLVTLLSGLSPALAHHNDVGARFAVGNPDPGVSDEPNTRDGLRPVYHAGGSPPTLAFVGDYPRLSPADQSGLGMGDWIGVIDGVVETFSDGFGQCVFNPSFLGCNRDTDPLYRANPASDHGACQGATERLASECDGSGHPWKLDIWPGARVQAQHYDVVGGDGAGFQFPGSYSFYLYLFGDGSGVAAGQGTFDYLDPDELCGETTGADTCALITPEDLSDHLPPGAVPAVCFFAPQFFPLTQASDLGECARQSRFDQYMADSDSTLYLANKPGWYATAALDDPFASTLSWASVLTKEGDQDHVSNVFHFYVNPEPLPSEKWCGALPVATLATDKLDTGVQPGIDGGWVEGDPIAWNLQGHDLDVYTSPTSDANGALQQAVQGLLDELPTLPPGLQGVVDQVGETTVDTLDEVGRTTDPFVEATLTAGQRFVAIKSDDAGPNHPLDNSLTLSAPSEGQQCSSLAGLARDATGRTHFYNYVEADIQGITLKDPTHLDEDGLPAKADEQGYNPWHPQQYTFGGELIVFDDRNGNVQRDACPQGNDAPDEFSPDICAARLPWDLSNPEATAGQGASLATFARDRGFTDPTGLYFVLNLTGRHLITDTEPPTGTSELDRTQQRSRVLITGGQHCIVGTSKGLLDGISGSRLATTLGLPNLSEAALLDHLCSDATGERILLEDGFEDQSQLGEIDAGIAWTKLSATPDVSLSTDDGLTLHALVTVEADGDELTRGNLELGTGTTATQIATWQDGSAVSYRWTDVELFSSEPAE